MKKFILALSAAAAFAAFPSFALAQSGVDPQAATAVKAMFDAMEMRKNMAAMNAQMQQAMPAMMRQQMAAAIQGDAKMSPEQKSDALAKLEKELPGMTQTLGKVFNDPTLLDEMIDAMVPLYANNYTAAEIKQLTAFYQSPVGRKMMALTPRLATEGMMTGQRIMMPRIAKVMQDMAKDVKKP